MNKVILLVSRRNGGQALMDHVEQFQRLLAELPEMRRCIVSLADVTAKVANQTPIAPYEAVVEMWFDSVEAYTEASRTPAGRLTAGDAEQGRYVYLIRERIQLDRPRTWEIGERSPGVKSVYVVRRPDGTTREEAKRLWLAHASVAREHHVGMCKYVQDGVLRSLTEGSPRIDAIAELHFPTVKDLEERMYDSEEGEAAIRADTVKLAGESSVMLTSEYILAD